MHLRAPGAPFVGRDPAAYAQNVGDSRYVLHIDWTSSLCSKVHLSVTQVHYARIPERCRAPSRRRIPAPTSQKWENPQDSRLSQRPQRPTPVHVGPWFRRSSSSPSAVHRAGFVLRSKRGPQPLATPSAKVSPMPLLLAMAFDQTKVNFSI